MSFCKKIKSVNQNRYQEKVFFPDVFTAHDQYYINYFVSFFTFQAFKINYLSHGSLMPNRKKLLKVITWFARLSITNLLFSQTQFLKDILAFLIFLNVPT
jgi:hypothetical protein